MWVWGAALALAISLAAIALTGAGPAPKRTVRRGQDPVFIAPPAHAGTRPVGRRRSRVPAKAGKRLDIGLTEANANLLRSPGVGGGGPAGFSYGRELVSALHPDFVRVVVDWAALQPSPGLAPRLDLPVDGCGRGVGPCGPYGGLRDELSAIASQRGSGAGAPQVVLVLTGVPGWAARPPAGCERGGTTAFSRPIRSGALDAYRSLIGSVLALGRSLGVDLPWWTPWNEPNHPAFISPQRPACTTASPSLAPGVYAQLERAMAAELAQAGGRHRILLGELAGLTLSSPHTTSIAEFVANVPSDVLCASDVWSVHAYPGRRATALSPVSELEAALNARGGCARRAHIWVTETGAGAAHAGDPRPPGVGQQVAGCQAMAAQLRDWYRDPRVDAAFQYEFRDDIRFPVGLANAGLTQAFPAYYLWRAWTSARPGAVPTLPRACT